MYVISHLTHVLVIACIILTIALGYEGAVKHVAQGKDNVECVRGMGCDETSHMLTVLSVFCFTCTDIADFEC